MCFSKLLFWFAAYVTDAFDEIYMMHSKEIFLVLPARQGLLLISKRLTKLRESESEFYFDDR